MYVRHINVVGNTRTRDEVMRREMRQLESSWFDSNRLALSKDRVNRLGYFTDVTSPRCRWKARPTRSMWTSR